MRHIFLSSGLLALTACAPAADQGVFDTARSASEGAVEVRRGVGPPDADPNACYGLQVRPAVIETVTDQVMVQPEQTGPDGTVLQPAVFVTEQQQRIVQERREIWFETPCEAQTDPDFIASLQRALQVRGLYTGPINGQMTRRTERAIRAFQEPQGLDSATLSLASARQLGLALFDPALAGRDE